MRLVAKQASIAAGLLVVLAALAAPALAHDEGRHRHRHHHHPRHLVEPGHFHHRSAPRVVYERPIVYRDVPVYYGPPMPPSININIPLR